MRNVVLYTILLICSNMCYSLDARTNTSGATSTIPPILNCDFSSGLQGQGVNLQLFNDQNQQLDSKSVKIENFPGIGKALIFDGNSYLITRYSHNGSISLRLKVYFSQEPEGMLFSRNRPEDGLRGFECGLAKDKFFLMDGKRPTAMVCSGYAKSIRSLISPAKVYLKAKVWYEIFFRFSTGKQLQLDVFDLTNSTHIYTGRVDCPQVKQILSEAGEKYLAIGGRRANSKSGQFLVPPGTAITSISVWNASLDDKTVQKLTNIKFTSSTETSLRAPMTLHVSVGNSRPDADGSSEEKALSTIQEALDNVIPGDTVLVHPGVYYEIPVLRVNGLPDKNIVIRAANFKKNSVILTAAQRDMREGKVKWKLVDGALGLYNAPCDHLPARVLYSGTDLMPYPSLVTLKTFTLLDNYPGAMHGFYYDKDSELLFVRLHADGRYGSDNPNNHTMCISPPSAGGSNGTAVYRPEHSNLFIETGGVGNIVIEGITFESPGATGVASRAGNVVVRDCWFSGCRFGVFGVKNPSSVTVEFCEYNQFPAFDDMEEIINKYRGTPVALQHPIYWWHRKGKGNTNDVMKNYETGIIGGVGQGWVVASNYIHDAFEGMSCWAVSDASDLEVRDNMFLRLVDNAVETENHARNVRIHHNDFQDIFEPISWQPLGGMPWPGPVFVYRNRFITSNKARSLWPWTPGCFKIGVSGKNWETQSHMGNVPISEMRSRISKRFVVVPYPGFLVFNNTILYPHGYLLTTPQPVNRELVNFKFFNNIISVKGMNKNPDFTGSLIEFFNNAVFASSDQKRASTMAGLDGIVVADSAQFMLVDADVGNITLGTSSQLCARGTLLFNEAAALLDLGALAAGQSWNLGHTGPRVSSAEAANYAKTQ